MKIMMRVAAATAFGGFDLRVCLQSVRRLTRWHCSLGGFTKYDSFGNVVLAKHAHVCGRQQIARMRMLENVFWNKFDNSRF